jgi:hypothetical protein
LAWNDTANDDLAEPFLNKLIEAVETKAKAKDLHVPWYWLNTAGATQNPFAYYADGTALPKLKQISKKYDPHQVFQRLVPGFKLKGYVSGA